MKVGVAVLGSSSLSPYSLCGRKATLNERQPVVIYNPLHTLGIAFRHLPPNSARISYVTEGELFISAQLAVHRRGQRPQKGLGTTKTMDLYIYTSVHD